MADRTSAHIFARLFTMLASDPPPDHATLVRQVWKLSQGYDFMPEQMECNDALLRLGLARVGIDPDWPNEGPMVLYGPKEPSP